MRRRLEGTWEPIGELQTFFSHWLNRAEAQVAKKFARQVKELGIIPSEWAALRHMYRPGRTCSLALAEAIGMSKGGASKLIGRLVKKGLATREVGELDRRCRPVGLTTMGKRLVPLLALLAQDNDSKFFGKLPKKIRHSLMKALRRVAFAHRITRVDLWRFPSHGAFVRWKSPSAEWDDGS
jgi:DNA-binding MarR family transcriptional regulator